MMLLLACLQYFVIATSAILVVPPFFLLPLWAVTIPAMMVERTDIAGAFNRSMDLTRYRRLPILGTFVLWALLFGVGAVVIVLLLGHGQFAHLVLWVYSAVAATVVLPLPAIFYVLLREEKEGVTAEQIHGGRSTSRNGYFNKRSRRPLRASSSTACSAMMLMASLISPASTIRNASTRGRRRTASSSVESGAAWPCAS